MTVALSQFSRRVGQRIRSGAEGRPMGLLDRPWAAHRSAMLVAPVHTATPQAVRTALAEHARCHPTGMLASRIDAGGGRWLPVGAEAMADHLDRVVIAAGDPSPDGFEDHIRKHLGDVAADLPFVVVVGTRSVTLFMSHAVGDAPVLSGLMLALATADTDRLAGIERRVGMPALVGALIRQAWPHHRDWLRHMRGGEGPPVPSRSAAAAVPRPAIAEAVAGNPTMRAITRWRTANAKGASLTSILGVAGYRALTARGVDVHGGGFYTLVDMRGLLPPGRGPVWGNLANSLYLAADLDDPRSVAAAMDAATDSARVLPTTVMSGLTRAVRGRRVARSDMGAPTGPLMLTVNSVPSPPGLAELPWREGSGRRFLALGLSGGPEGITLFAVRMRDHLQLAMSFDETTADPAAVRDVLDVLADPAAVLATLDRSG